MSGFVALIRDDGVESRTIERLTATLAARGPDRQRAVAFGPVGLGHALLATGAHATADLQPLSLGALWITGDLRVDARRDLCAALEPHARCDLSDASDAELVLRAYRVWSDRCVEHLLGDFAFAIWDGDRRRLFCARDPFGVKLLYFAGGGRTFLAGNTLACLRSDPRVSDRLDDRAVASFLLWGEHDDRGATILADVRSLPAGHRLSWSPGDAQPSVRRWFTLPDAAPSLAYDDRRDTIDHFRTLLDEAVEDRLRCRSAAVFMSGGIDSPMVAAAAATRLGARDGRVTAQTIVFDPLLPDRERQLSSLAASHLRIPIAHTQGDGVYTDWGWMRTTRAPEPPMGPATLPALEAYRRVSAEHRVALTGYDGDSLLAHALGPLWRARLRGGDLPTLAREVAWHVRRRRLPRIGVRAAWARRRGGRDVDVGYPEWVRPAFATGQSLRERWRSGREATGPEGARGPARRAFESTAWRNLLDAMDPGMTGFPIEHRHPLLDLRLVRFALSLAPVPWCVDKHLFRAAMRDALPPVILRRPKEPLAGDPITAGLATMSAPPELAMSSELAEYVDPARVHDAWRGLGTGSRAPAGPIAFAAFNTAVLAGWLAGPARAAPEPFGTMRETVCR